ncbi:MAG TPA: iron-containing redox enzyme family protein [Bryobacteraceae bacterium]|nr:iron-containing redox enzyme family protein [Bryobacteraceae bacterium]
MASTSLPLSSLCGTGTFRTGSIRESIDIAVEEALGTLPDAQDLSAEQRRGILARYAAVLEGNFIYWMTATLLSVKSGEAREIILENLREEIRDCHPGMMRRFVLAAHAAPTEADFTAVYRDLTNVRLFLGRLSPIPNLVTMAFFEGFIQRFAAYLADLARRQGSADMEYTDVHGICDVTHTQELFRALELEMALGPLSGGMEMMEGVGLLRRLLGAIVFADAAMGVSPTN